MAFADGSGVEVVFWVWGFGRYVEVKGVIEEVEYPLKE